MATIFVFILLCVASAPLNAADGGDKAEAERYFMEGLARVTVRDFEAAVVSFESALEKYPTKSALFNLGVAYKKSNRYVAAFKTFSELFKVYKGKLEPDEEAYAIKHLGELKQEIAELKVQTIPAGAEVMINGEVKAPSEEGTILLTPDTYELTVSMDGYLTKKRPVELAGGERRIEVIALQAARSGPDTPASSGTAGSKKTGTDAKADGKAPQAVARPQGSKPDEPICRSAVTSPPKKKHREKVLTVMAFTSMGATVAVGGAFGGTFFMFKRNLDEYNHYNDLIETRKITEDNKTALSGQYEVGEKAQRHLNLSIGFGIATAALTVLTTSLFLSRRAEKHASERIGFHVTPAGMEGRF